MRNGAWSWTNDRFLVAWAACSVHLRANNADATITQEFAMLIGPRKQGEPNRNNKLKNRGR